MKTFFDTVSIIVRSGDGGNGAVSFRREKGVPKGGPDGGRGGDGGSVLLRADAQMSTLSAFRRKRRFNAERGVNGRGKDMYGRKGQDVVVEVPAGTEVWLDGKPKPVRVADLTAAGEEYVAAVGGRGGKGNADFGRSALHRARPSRQCFPGRRRADVGRYVLCRMGHGCTVHQDWPLRL